MQAEADALPIVLDFSGDQDNWPQLQGSVTIFVERYLHLDTNLWFNTKGYYLPGDWQMPAPPLGPASIEVIEPEPQALDTQDGLETNSGFDTLGWRETPLAEDPNTPDPALDAPTYPWRHAVLMQQSRRMRSHEVHYIDHPLFGAVIKLTPLDEETLETMAAERAEIDAELRGDQPAGEDSAAMSACSRARTAPAPRARASRIESSVIGASDNPAAGFTTMHTLA